jgi:putative two-component system response regulator
MITKACRTGLTKKNQRGLLMIEKSVNKSTVMVVDDTPENIKILQNILLEEGYNIRAFPSGEMALTGMEKETPDLILLDIMMPGLDGYSFCDHIKRKERYKNIPVIFISALDTPYDKVKAFYMGGVDYITKPFQPQEVLMRVRTHLRIKNMQLQLEKHNNHLEELVSDKIKEIKDAQKASILALAKVTEYRDYETGRHNERVSLFCKAISEDLLKDGYYSGIIDSDFISNIYYAAPLHDIGKVGIPDRILLKPGLFLYEEYEIMKGHVTIGGNILDEVKKEYPKNQFINMGIEISSYHHEKWDGTGYNKGLKGEEIPLSARIIAIADVYDALRSKRPYKEPFSHEKSCKIITNSSGTHFQPLMVDKFIELEKEFEKIYEENV